MLKSIRSSIKNYYNEVLFLTDVKHILLEDIEFHKINDLLRKFLRKDREEIFSKYYTPAVELFVKRLEEVKPNFDFYYLRDNLRDLTIKSSLSFKEKNNVDLLAYYDWQKNKISLSAGNIFSCIYHELMHMASTDASNEENIYCGFSQINSLRNIGCSFNEGYTELLTERYFFDQGIDYCYSIEVKIAKIAEKIVGKDKMEELFFKADLYGLCEEFIKDTTKEDFIQFLDDVDYIQSKRDGKYTEKFKDIYQRIWEFLYFTYFKKQVRLYDSKKISEEEYQENITFILDLIVSERCVFDKHDFSNCNRKRLQKQFEIIDFEVDFSLIADDKILIK